MGKEKIEEKDVRLLRYAVEQAFDGAMRDGALALLNRLVDSASEAANLEEELLNLKGEYQRSMENSKRGAFKRLDAAYKRKCRREKRMAKGQMLCADGKPVMFGETLYGGDGRDWLIVGIAGAWSYSIRRAIDRDGTAGGYHWEYLDERKEVSTDDHYQADGRAE